MSAKFLDAINLIQFSKTLYLTITKHIAATSDMKIYFILSTYVLLIPLHIVLVS